MTLNKWIYLTLLISYYSCNCVSINKKEKLLLDVSCNDSIQLKDIDPRNWEEWKDDSMGVKCKRFAFAATYDLTCLFKGSSLDTLVNYLGKPSFLNLNERFGAYNINVGNKNCSSFHLIWYLDFEFDSNNNLIQIKYGNPDSGYNRQMVCIG